MRYKFVFVAFLAVLLSVLAPVAAPSLAVSSAYAATVSTITVEGNQRIERETFPAWMQYLSRLPKETQALFASIIAFWFGSQAFESRARK